MSVDQFPLKIVEIDEKPVGIARFALEFSSVSLDLCTHNFFKYKIINSV